MERRDFLKQAAIATAAAACTSQAKASSATPPNPIVRRTLGKTGERPLDYWFRRDFGDERGG